VEFTERSIASAQQRRRPHNRPWIGRGL